MKKRGAAVQQEPAPNVSAPTRPSYSRAGKYSSLYEYLEKRYADTVVLTFRQLEDLLGFSLPDLARVDPEWWSPAERSTAEVRCSDAWALARRSARPNLMAQTVVFERIP
jgi:hypothetical protein